MDHSSTWDRFPSEQHLNQHFSSLWEQKSVLPHLNNPSPQLFVHHPTERLQTETEVLETQHGQKNSSWKQRCLHELFKAFHECVDISFSARNSVSVWLLKGHQLDKGNDVNKSRPTDRTASSAAPRTQTRVCFPRDDRANAKWIYMREQCQCSPTATKRKISYSVQSKCTFTLILQALKYQWSVIPTLLTGLTVE